MKIMNVKKTIITIALLACFIPCAPAALLTVGVSNVTAAPGSTVDVPVTVSGAQGLGSMDLAMSYDPAAVSVVSVDKGSLGKGLFSSNTGKPGIVTVSIADPAGISGDGSVAIIKVKVNGDAGTTSDIAIYNVLAYDVKTHLEIPVQKTDGMLTVKKGGWGLPGFGFAAVAGALVVLGVLRRFRKS
jgi:hypothetical protein